MNLEELRAYKPQILTIAKQYGVSDIRVFGSVAHDDANENNDIDLMIHMEKMLSAPVDLVEIEVMKTPCTNAIR